jgi:Xaa-Pro aminopeptidase
MFPTYLILPKGQEPILLIGQTESENARVKFGGEIAAFANYNLNERMLSYPNFVADEAWKFISKLNLRLRRVGMEYWYSPQRLVESLRKNGSGIELFDLSDRILEFRTCKDQDEIHAMIASCELNDYAMTVAKSHIIPGRSEVEVYAKAHKELTKRVGTFQSYIGDFTSGERSVQTGGPPTNRIIREGETFTVDSQVESDGYWSDITRTYVVGGKTTMKHIELFELLKSAMQASERTLRPGALTRDVYAAGHSVISGAGYGKFFPHHMGHGLGLDQQEAPFFIPGSHESLRENMICCLEPAVYIPGFGGIRIENDYLVTSDGYRNLTKIPMTIS